MIKAILALKISYMILTYILLFLTHFEGWERLGIKTTIYYLLEKINLA